MDAAQERRARLEDLETKFEESVSALQVAENSRNRTPLALSSDALGLGGGVSARSLGLAGGGGLARGNPLSFSDYDLTGSSFQAQLRSSFSSGGSGMLDALRRGEGMPASALGYPSSAVGFQGSSDDRRFSDLSLGLAAGSGSFANSALQQGLLETADSQSKVSAAAAASRNMNNMSLDAAALRNMVRMSDRGEPVSNLTADRRDLQERILAMQLAKGYEQGSVRGNTNLGLPMGTPQLSRFGSGDYSASLGLARSASQQLPGLSSASSAASSLSQYASNAALSQDLLQQQILQRRQQLLTEEDTYYRRRMSEMMSTMSSMGEGAAGGNTGGNAGINLAGERTQATSAQWFHGLTDSRDPDPKRRRFN